jgi:hypothetical protein
MKSRSVKLRLTFAMAIVACLAVTILSIFAFDMGAPVRGTDDFTYFPANGAFYAGAGRTPYTGGRPWVDFGTGRKK